MNDAVAAIDPLASFRSEFPILARTNYLVSNSLGAVPRGVGAELASYYATWATRGVRAWEEGWWTLAADLGNELAPLIGARTGEVVFQPTVTLAHAVVLSALDYRIRTRIVTDELHFPSILYLLEGTGAEIVRIPSDDQLTIDTGRLLAAIDERTASVCVSHVLFRSSYIHDVPAIAARARAVGALSVIDGYQAVGSIPVDVRALGVDVYIGGCLKWLCGGPGAAFLWVNPDLRGSLQPRLTGWMAHRRPFAFEPALDRRDDAWRFLHGTPGIPSLHAARPGLRLIRSAGIDAIRAKSQRQTTLFIDRAATAGFQCRVPADSARRGGTVAVDVPEGLPVSRALKAREILCDFRPGAGIRLAPHFYNTDAEVEAAIFAMADILRTGEWRQFTNGGGPVT